MIGGFILGISYAGYVLQKEVPDTCTPQLFEDHCGCLEDSLIQEIEP